MKNRSLHAKILTAFLLFSALFLLFFGVINAYIIQAEFRKSEEDKIEILLNTIMPTLSSNATYHFDDAITEMGESLIKNHENLVGIKVTVKGSVAPFLFLRDPFHNPFTIKGGSELYKSESIYDIDDTSQRIGRIEIYFANSHYLSAMENYLHAILYSSVVFIVMIVFLSMWFVYILRPLRHLSNEIEDYNPENSTMQTFDPSGLQEIDSISHAVNAMVNRLDVFYATERQLSKDLQRNQLHFLEAQRIAKLGSWEVNMHKNSLFVSQEFLAILGIFNNQTLIGWKTLWRYIHKRDRRRVLHAIAKAVKSGEMFEVEHQVVTVQGRNEFILTSGHVKYIDNELIVFGTSLAITEQVKNKELISHMAFHDPLTDLANKLLFTEKLNQAIAEAERSKALLAILLITIDDFAQINHRFGHDAGDYLLIDVAQSLVDHFRTMDTVARFSGDEFIVLLPSIKGEREAYEVASRFAKKARSGWNIDGNTRYLHFSMGISLYPNHADNADALIKNATDAMVAAKTDPEHKILIYS
jgi:diguanylate cyclase (GGDEF)-like protein